jgi:protein-tyrosine phosphatase
MRNKWEIATNPEPSILGIRSTAYEFPNGCRKKNTTERFAPGVISEYGAPEERMKRNYRSYATKFLLFGRILSDIVAEGVPSLIHCVNGKDRTGVLSAVIMKIGGAGCDDIMANYLLTNRINALTIAREFEQLSHGMTPREKTILMSFLEARPVYLTTFFDEIDALYGSFDRYLSEGLRLSFRQQETLREMLVY